MTGWTERELETPEEFVTALFAFYEDRGRRAGDAGVTAIEHAVQAARLARAEGAADALVVAALLHDVGHLLLDERDPDPASPALDRRHEAVGAAFLHRWFPPAVAGPVVFHVRAKRYLAAIDPTYAAGLSAASRRRLVVQGGRLRPWEVEAFETLPHAEAATQLRRWDDRARVPGLRVEPLAAFADLVGAQVMMRRARAPVASR